MKHDWDVIVCGGGPAGLGTAAALHAAFSGGLRILVLVTAQGSKILSDAAPREVADIEVLMRDGS